jgi:hypothetical protein
MKQLFAATLLLAASSVASANLVTNGSFEADTQTSGSWNVYSSLTGWTSVSGAGIEVRNNVVGTAYDGVNFVELDSHNNSAMVQTIYTSPNAWYDLSFAYSPRIGQPAATNGIEVWWDNILLDTITADGSSANVWSLYHYLVKGSEINTLKFAATGINDSLGGNIDAVSLTPSPVPVPAAAWLFGSALLGFVSLSNRRKV